MSLVIYLYLTLITSGHFHSYPVTGHIFLALTIYKKKNQLQLLFVPFLFQYLAEAFTFHTVYTLYLCHLPYLSIPSIFHLRCHIDAVIWQYSTSCLSRQFAYYSVTSKFAQNINIFLPLAIFTCHFKYPTHFIAFLSLVIFSYQFQEYSGTLALFAIICSFPIPIIRLSIYFSGDFHIIFLPHTLLSWHLPYLPVPSIFPLYFHIPPLIWQYSTSCLSN